MAWVSGSDMLGGIHRCEGVRNDVWGVVRVFDGLGRNRDGGLDSESN